ncbi:hypothetical protein Ahy_A07g033850 [Arachis hypogaea]|uniref:Uncharacterized protein n=1 Tax=Arachis hypogaea TaxID=3818 RepID=A0A445CAA8_ARAHY|nr:hypothetical protein Ahy_A07g033850 [Arachis hypogaea]
MLLMLHIMTSAYSCFSDDQPVTSNYENSSLMVLSLIHELWLWTVPIMVSMCGLQNILQDYSQNWLPSNSIIEKNPAFFNTRDIVILKIIPGFPILTKVNYMRSFTSIEAEQSIRSQHNYDFAYGASIIFNHCNTQRNSEKHDNDNNCNRGRFLRT